MISERAARVVTNLLERAPALERLLVRGCRSPTLRSTLRLGAFANLFARVGGPARRVANLGDYRVEVDISDYQGLVPYFFGDDGVSWVVDKVVRAGDTCLDIGANRGMYAARLASIVGAGGLVHAFEPNPPLFSLLRETERLNGWSDRLHFHKEALSSERGAKVRFYVSSVSQNSGLSSLDRIPGRTESPPIEVETDTLDAFVQRERLERVRFAKIDVEGAEDRVLAGAEATLREQRVDYWIIEMKAHSTAHTALRKHHYRCAYLEPRTRETSSAVRREAGVVGDFVAVSPRCADEAIHLGVLPSQPD